MQDKYGDDFAVLDLLVDATTQSELTTWESSAMGGAKLSGRPTGNHRYYLVPTTEIGIPYNIVIDGTTMQVKMVGNGSPDGAIQALLN